MNQWSNFFVAQTGASAALAGLIFVAVSLNLKRILSVGSLPNRAIQSLVTLVTLLLVSSLMLVPGQSLFCYGVELLLITVPVWIFSIILDYRSLKKTESQYRKHVIQAIILGQVALIPYLIAGIVLMGNHQAGTYFIVPAVIFSFFRSTLDAWVLLVEINR